MDRQLLAIFLLQVQLQCHAIGRAAERLREALNRTAALNRTPTSDNFDTRMEAIDDAFVAVQDMLNAAGNVSKALWGQQGRRARERRYIRDALGVRDDSALRQVVMRNHFEHVDERIDQWWQESPTHNYVDRNIGSIGGNFNEMEVFRNLDPVTWEVVFWGDRFDLAAIAAEARRLSEPLAMRNLFKLPDDFVGDR